jgi:RNA polymerase sigma-70 factor (ECF subfamily)
MKELDFRNDVLPLKDKLFRLALRITLSREDAEDIVQDTLLKVWNNRAEMDAVSNIEAYAMTICRNQALDLCARKERMNISLDEKAHDRTDTYSMPPDEKMAQDEGKTLIRQTIDSLPEKQRTAMLMREIEGKTYKEIAQVMNITESDVKINIFRARKSIKEHLAKISKYGL